jgi:hypothetical protein
MKSFLIIATLLLISAPLRNAAISDTLMSQSRIVDQHRLNINVPQLSLLGSTNSSDSSNKCTAEYKSQSTRYSIDEPLRNQHEQQEDSVFYVEDELFVLNNIQMIYARDEIDEMTIDDEEGYECSIAFSTSGSQEFVHVFEDNHRTIYTFSRDDAWIVHKSRREEGYFRTIAWENVLDGPLYELRPTLKMTIRTARLSERPIMS